MPEPFLQIQNLTKRFGTHAAADDVSLEIERGEILALLGPSGSGKTTMLRLLAGFERPDSGSVQVDGRNVTSHGPAERRFGMVFQHYALFPHLNVGENVAFGLTNLAKLEIQNRVSEVLDLVDLGGFEKRDVSTISGGQQQRVAVARALAPNPPVLLLDEPLSNLDPALREKTRTELRSALKEVGITTIFVTHEQEEAFALGDVVAVLNEGKLQQVGPAPELYENPSNLFVATFVGRASVLRGTMVGIDRARVADDVEWDVKVARGMVQGTAVDVVVRPQHLTLGTRGIEGTITSVRYGGARAYFSLDVGDNELEVESSIRSAAVGDKVRATATMAYAFPREPSEA